MNKTIFMSNPNNTIAKIMKMKAPRNKSHGGKGTTSAMESTEPTTNPEISLTTMTYIFKSSYINIANNTRLQAIHLFFPHDSIE